MYDKFKLIPCSTANEFWETLSPQKPLKTGACEFIYRGQRDANWELMPLIFRDDKDNPSIAKRIFSKLGIEVTKGGQEWCEWIVLKNFVHQCDMLGLHINNDSARFREYHLGRDNPYKWPDEALIDVMALAQHHGVPTRLLDWTYRSYVAAYFAVLSALATKRSGWKSDARIAVWALDIETINLYRNIKIVKVPGSTSQNLAAQSGLFTLTGLLDSSADRRLPFQAKPLEDEFESLPDTPLRKITLPVECSSEVLNLCRSLRISASILFPGFDGAAKAVEDCINNDDLNTRNS